MSYETMPALPGTRQKGGGMHGRGAAVVRWLCIAVVLAVLMTLGHRIGVGIGRVRRGEQTMAGMLSGLGLWLRGGEEVHVPEDGGEVVQPEPDQTVDAQDTLYDWNAAAIPAGARPIVPIDLVGEDPPRDSAGEDWEAPAISDDAGPLVLIVHSHTGEGYTPEGTVYLPGDAAIGRPTDQNETVVAIGAALAEQLKQQGIGVLHITAPFDEEGNIGAFDRAAAAVAEALAQYPNIRYVLDIHRDTGVDEVGRVLRAVAWYEGAPTAQLRLLAPNALPARALAGALCNRLNTGARLCRPVGTANLDGAWSQDGVIALRVEVGTSGVTPEEAARAACALGRAFVGEIQKK